MAHNVFTIDLAEQFAHLDSSPVVEAVIHWAARAGKPLDESALRRELVERIPDYPHIQSLHWKHLQAVLRPDGATSHVGEGWHGLRLTSEDKLFVVQFTRNGVVFSRLAPYHDWEDFSEAGIQIWNLYRDVAEPTEVQRLGVRFINRIPIKDGGQARRFLSQAPKCLEGMSLPSETFMYQNTHRVPGHPYGINVTRTVPPMNTVADGTMSLIVDIDVFTTAPFEVGESDSRGHLRYLRWLKDKAFFSLMTKKALAEFAKQRGIS